MPRLHTLRLGGSLSFLLKVDVRPHQHLPAELLDQRLKHTIVRLAASAVPGANLAEAVQDKAQLAADDLAVVRVALLADLLVAAPQPPRVQKLDAEAIRHA